MNKYSTADSMVGVMRDQLVNMRELAVGAANTALNSPEAQIAYQRSGELLAEHFPPGQGDRDELPNHLIVLE